MEINRSVVLYVCVKMLFKKSGEEEVCVPSPTVREEAKFGFLFFFLWNGARSK